MTKIKLSEEFYNKHNNKNFDKLLAEIKKQETYKTRGFLKINGVYVSYNSFLTLDHIGYYINCNNANGSHKYKLNDMLKTMSTMDNLTFSHFEGLVFRCKFRYTIVSYDDINFIYVFNDKYVDMFKD